MRTIALSATLLLLPLALPAAAAAQEPHFTVRVPVSLADIVPERTSFQVWCELYEHAGLSATLTKSALIPLSADGGYSGPPIEIAIQGTANFDNLTLSLIAACRCELKLCLPNGTCASPGAAGDLTYPPDLRARSGTPFKNHTMAPIPPPQ